MAPFILSSHLWQSCVNSGLIPHKFYQIAKPSTGHFCKTQDIFPYPNRFYKTLPNQLDGISPLTEYHNKFLNVPFVIFLVINSRLPRMALRMLKKAHYVFLKSRNRFSNSRFKSDIKEAYLSAASCQTSDCDDNVGKWVKFFVLNCCSQRPSFIWIAEIWSYILIIINWSFLCRRVLTGLMLF